MATLKITQVKSRIGASKQQCKNLDALAKEKLNLFMKGQDADLDEIYDKFGVDYNLLSLLMRREADSEGKLHIRWGEQNIA